MYSHVPEGEEDGSTTHRFLSFLFLHYAIFFFIRMLLCCFVVVTLLLQSLSQYLKYNI